MIFKMIAGSRRDIIQIPEKTVEIETGEWVQVEPFLADRNCVTLEMFLNFQKETGYVTLAGETGMGSHILNEVNKEMRTTDRMQSSVCCLTPKDAFEFCNWVGGRLLTEEEWMAASIIDQRIIDQRSPEYKELWDSDRRLKLCNDPLALVLEREYTSTPAAGNCIIARRGPMYYRDSKWRQRVVSNRIPIRITEPDFLSSFRVCYSE